MLNQPINVYFTVVSRYYNIPNQLVFHYSTTKRNLGEFQNLHQPELSGNSTKRSVILDPKKDLFRGFSIDTLVTIYKYIIYTYTFKSSLFTPRPISSLKYLKFQIFQSLKYWANIFNPSEEISQKVDAPLTPPPFLRRFHRMPRTVFSSGHSAGSFTGENTRDVKSLKNKQNTVQVYFLKQGIIWNNNK